jgi:hypothetical protein
VGLLAWCAAAAMCETTTFFEATKRFVHDTIKSNACGKNSIIGERSH